MRLRGDYEVDHHPPVVSMGGTTVDLAGRGFTAHPLFSAFAASGDRRWRASENAVLAVLERLSEESFLSEIAASDDKSKGPR